MRVRKLSDGMNDVRSVRTCLGVTIALIIVVSTLALAITPISAGPENFSVFNTQSGVESRALPAISGTSQWDAEVLWSDVSMVGGCTIGDLDKTRKGNEVVAVTTDGRVVLLHKTDNDKWDSQQLWQGKGQLLTPVIGNFYPQHDGNELVVVGMAVGKEGEGAGHATMIWGAGDNWNDEVIFNNTDSMLHGAAVGDLDPNHDGAELVVMSFGFDVKMITWTGPEVTDWNSALMWHGEGKVRKGLIDDFDPNHDGNELVVVDKSGNCTMITGTGTTWEAKTLWTDPGTPGLARVAVGNADPTYDGKELVVGGDSNNVGIIRRTGDTWNGDVIFTDSDSIRGLGIGDVDPTIPGNEIVIFGYSRKVTLLWGSGDAWQSRVLFTDTGRAHDLAVGEFDSDHSGLEIAFVGYSNNVTMLSVSPWVYDVMFTDTSMIGGCAIGDLDKTRKGNEVVTASTDGLVSLLYKSTSGTWASQQLWQGKGQLLTPVIGDFYPQHDGNELVVVGMAVGKEGEGAGHATMIWGAGDNWQAEVIFNNTDSMLHGAAVGDLDSTHDGNELVVMSFGFDVKMLTWTGPGVTDWSSTLIWHGEGKVRKGVIDDVDPNHKGNELVVVDKSGNLTMLRGSGTTWEAKTLWTDPGTPGLARVAVGDADTTYPGKEIVVGGDSNNVGIIRRTGDTWEGSVIFTDSDSIRGLGIGDVDPVIKGNEILVFGYSKKVTMLSGSGSTWASKVLFTDVGRSHDLALGEFDSDHKGQEVVFVGYSNNATMLKNIEQQEMADFDIYAYPSAQEANSGETIDYTIGAISLAGFNEPVHFTVEGVPEDLAASFYPISVIPESTTTLSIAVPHTNQSSKLDLKISAASGELVRTVELELQIVGDTEAPDVARTIPTDDDEEIPPERPIVIWFSEVIDSNTLTPDTISIIEDETGTKYIGTMHYNQESNMLIISAIHEEGGLNGLPHSKLIRISIATNIKDLAGNNIAEKYRFKFITSVQIPDAPIIPEIESIYPLDKTKEVSLDSPVIIHFGVPMDYSTLTWDNIEITSSDANKYTGTINYDPESFLLIITDIYDVNNPTERFSEGSEITVLLKTGILSESGEPLEEYSWGFTTGKEAADKEGDEFDNERNLYLGLIIVLIIILILFAIGLTKKNQPSPEKEMEESKPTRKTTKTTDRPKPKKSVQRPARKRR